MKFKHKIKYASSIHKQCLVQKNEKTFFEQNKETSQYIQQTNKKQIILKGK
jgi:hypothetical protein